MSDTALLDADVAVIGAGPTGMAACLEASRRGYSVAFVAPSTTHLNADQRTTAIMMPGIEMLDAFGVWGALKSKAAGLDVLRIVDGTSRLLRAPTVDFHASEIGEASFGYNIRNLDLNAALNAAVDGHASITTIDAMASAVAFDPDHAMITLSDGRQIQAKLVVGADGNQSLVRKSAGLNTRSWAYPQTAVVLTFDHSRPHHNVSTEFHTETGPFTQVPLPGNASSLVWVVKPERAEKLCGLDDQALSAAIESRMASMLGKVTVSAKAQKWPLSSLVAEKFSARRIVLVGHAAHAFPPIGAQGLNLGLRDVSDLGHALAKARSADPGIAAVTDHYHRARKADIWVRTGAVDLLNRSLLSDFLPVQALRATGLSALKHLPPLRGLFMREGMMPGRGLRDGLSDWLPFKREQKSPAAESPSS